MSPLRMVAGLALVVAMATVAANARTTAYNGFKVTVDIPKDTWEYFDIELTASDFLGDNETVDYKVFIETDITAAFTAQLWFGTGDVTDTATAGEIDPDATAMGRGDRSGEGATPGPGNFVLSVYTTCDACNTISTEVSMYLVDGNNNMVPFKIRPDLSSADFEVPEGEVLVWGFHNNTAAVDDDIYVQMELADNANRFDVIYETGAYPTALSNRYPTGPSLNGGYVSAPLAAGPGVTYFGSLGVSTAVGDFGHHVRLGINQPPSPLDVGPPNCAGEFFLAGDETDYSAIADCVTFDGSIAVSTSATLEFSLPNLESITGTLLIESPLSSLSLPALVTAGHLTIGYAGEICAVETLSLPSLTTVDTGFKVACEDLRAFDLPAADDLGLCEIFWAGEDPAEIDIPCSGVLVSSFIPVDLTFPLLETATHAGAQFIAFGLIWFPNLVEVTAWAGIEVDIEFIEPMPFDVEVGDLEVYFPSLTNMDGELVAITAIEGGDADASFTIFMPELRNVDGYDVGLEVIARGEVIPVAIVAPKLEALESSLSVEGEATVYFDELVFINSFVDVNGGTVCCPNLMIVSGDITVAMVDDTCVLPDLSTFQGSVGGTISWSAPTCTEAECTAPVGLDQSGADHGAGGFGLVTLSCALVAVVATVVIGG